VHAWYQLHCLSAAYLQDNSSDALAKTKTDYDAFLADPANLKQVREQLKVRPDQTSSCCWA